MAPVDREDGTVKLAVDQVGEQQPRKGGGARPQCPATAPTVVRAKVTGCRRRAKRPFGTPKNRLTDLGGTPQGRGTSK
jgi:hypothetical protein